MPGLKIRALEAKRLKIPLAKPFSSSLGVYKHVDCVAVLVHTEGGPSGTGWLASSMARSKSCSIVSVRRTPA